MSSIIKTRGLSFAEEKKRILDMNELVQKRLEEIAAKAANPENEGFVTGIPAKAVAVQALLEGEDGESSNVIKAPEVNEEELIKQAEEAAQQIIDDARNQAEAILSDARSQAEREKDKIFSEAKTQGFEEGKLRAEKENELIRGELDRTRVALNKEYEARIEELEPQFIDVITSIYEKIFHVDLQSYRDILVYLISNTLSKIEGRSFLIHVSKDDYAFVSMQKKQLIADSGSSAVSIELVEDVSLGKNECFIETETGIFDCGIDTQLLELTKKLKLLSFEKN